MRDFIRGRVNNMGSTNKKREYHENGEDPYVLSHEALTNPGGTYVEPPNAIAGYARFFLQTLAHPVSTYGVAVGEPADGTPVSPGSHIPAHRPFPLRQILAFVAVSIVLGAILNFFVPHRKYSSGAEVAAPIAFIWFGYMGVVAILCKLVRGKATSEHTAWIGFQLTSVLFVVSSFVNLVGGMIATIPKVASWLVSLGELGNSVAHNSAYIFFLTQFALLNVYLPPALKKANGFGWLRCLAVGLGLSLFWVVFGFLFTADLRVH